MNEVKSVMIPAVEKAFIDLIAQSKISRLSRGLRNLIMDYFLLIGIDRSYWFLELVEDMQPFFVFLDLTEHHLDQFYMFPSPEEDLSSGEATLDS
ncbi:MAG TPA: hypothetical protein VM802_10105 [Chitinophaga sp.]|uniref:hypothetical protein n=1 Tax=Chitinophaga sp. TaxID=1869181 RepID=UPI002BB3CE4C|nr:hypothetical protein [Chitinophaga sp.]HVI45215.1 hypothetical protein [Chitinophaga sp.]